jgi:hypothetical protein
MKKSLLLYLFILAVLMNIFTYAYFSRKNAAEMKPAADQSGQVKKLQDSMSVIQNQMSDANYFSLENDQNAQEYIVDNNLDKIIPYDKFIGEVTDQLMAYNDKPDGNPYTGQTKLTDNKFIINKAKVLNHRWIVADYSDGEYWGEVFIKYFVNPDKTVSFEVVQSLLYQK